MCMCLWVLIFFYSTTSFFFVNAPFGDFQEGKITDDHGASISGTSRCDWMSKIRCKVVGPKSVWFSLLSWGNYSDQPAEGIRPNGGNCTEFPSIISEQFRFDFSSWQIVGSSSLIPFLAPLNLVKCLLVFFIPTSANFWEGTIAFIWFIGLQTVDRLTKIVNENCVLIANLKSWEKVLVSFFENCYHDFVGRWSNLASQNIFQMGWLRPPTRKGHFYYNRWTILPAKKKTISKGNESFPNQPLEFSGYLVCFFHSTL